MLPFRIHTGVVAPLERPNVDTDQIIPKQFLKRIERTGFGQFLFNDWRKSAEGAPDPNFILNQPKYAGASILVAAKNFGCGSSREHAVWALADFGVRAVIAPSFSDIFASNAFKNGIATVVLERPAVERLLDAAREHRIAVDLEAMTVASSAGDLFTFAMDPFRRECLLGGLDEIALTLAHELAIRAYEQRTGI